MVKCKKALMLIFVAPLAACQTTTASVCDGWSNLSPNAGTRSYIIANDKPFAQQVASHREFGRSQGCWK